MRLKLFIILVFFCAGLAHATVIDTGNILAFYNFEGTLANNGTLSATLTNHSLTYGTGKLDSSSITTGSGKYGDVSYTSGMNSNSISVCSWYYPTSLSSLGYIVNRFGGSTATNRVWYVSNFRNGGGTDLTGPGIDVGNGASVGFLGSTAGTQAVNQWTYVCMTYNSSAASNRAKIYINGSLSSQGDPITGNLLASTSIGWFVGSDNSGSSNFVGNIDAVLIVNATLKDSEVSALYSANGDPYYTAVSNSSCDNFVGRSTNTLTCSDACTISSAVDVGGNSITFDGSGGDGPVYVESAISSCGGILINACHVVVRNGGSLC